MIMFLHGPDTYRSRQRLRRLIEAFQAKYDKDGQSVVRLDGETLTTEEFRKAVGTAGLFSKRRLIVVDSFLASNKQKATGESILEALKSQFVPEDYVVIFWEPSLPAKKGADPLQAHLLKQKTEAFPLLAGANLRHWVVAEFERLQANINNDALDLLLSAVESDLWRMTTEGRTITFKDVEALVCSPTEGRIFSFTDALASRNQRVAMHELELILADGMHPLALVQVIGRQLRTLILVEEAARDSQHPATIAKRLAIHPYVAQKALAQLPKFRAGELVELFNKLVALDG